MRCCRGGQKLFDLINHDNNGQTFFYVRFNFNRSDVKLEKAPTSASGTSSSGVGSGGTAATIARRRKNYIIFEHNDEDTLI